MRVAVIDDWQDVAQRCADWSQLAAQADVRFFNEPFASEDDAAAKLADFEIILAIRERTSFPASLSKRLRNLKMFGMTGHRAALIDAGAMMDRGVTVCYTGAGPSGASTAELALGLMIAAARRIPSGDAALHDGRFQRGAPAGFLLGGKTIGLIGLGRIGSLMARYCRALDMRVLGWSAHLTDDKAQQAGATRVSKVELLAASDVVSLHLVLSDRTRGVIGMSDLARMKDGAILINTARAGLVDEAALVQAVQRGRIIAALDVYSIEPLPASHALVHAPNTVLTPHLGYSVIEVYEEYFRHGIENALAFLNGKPIRVLERPTN